MAAAAGSGSQVSQEELLRILKKVKDRELSVEEAICLVKGNEERAESRALPPPPPPPLLHNFTVYKYRYRRQKRIIQIDFYNQMIFNIEKGILKKKFSFAEVKSCEDKEGLRLLITFHAHQDYELEANSIEDKLSILRIMDEVLQSQKHGHSSVLKSFIKKNAHSEFILDGLLELRDEESNTWVKYLVNVTHDELIFYCSQQLEPQKISLSLAECSVSAGTFAWPSFTVHCNNSKYIFRIPINGHILDFEKFRLMRNDWVSLLQEQCEQNQSNPSPQLSPFNSPRDFNSEIPERPACMPYVPAENRTGEDPLIYEDIYNQNPHSPSQLASEAKQSKDTPTKLNGFHENPQILSPPPPPLPSKRLNTPHRTRAFHWNIVPQEKISKSIWGKNSLKKIDNQRIVHQFPANGVSAVTDSDISKNQNILLDKKIAHNFNIVLKSFHMEPEQLRDKLLIVRECDGGLSDEHLTNLRWYAPTSKDISMYLSYKGLPSELHVVDQFMLQMCQIPDLCSRLDTLISIRELPSYMKYLEPLLLQQMRACQQLLRSSAFPGMLYYILSMGNCLNENAGKPKARGFLLSSLTKMSQLASKERRFTFMHALVEQILLQEPDLANFYQELTEFEAVPGASVKGLKAEVDVLSKQLEAIVQYRKTFMTKHHRLSAREEQFLKDLKDITEHYGAQQVELVKKANEMKKLYADVLQTFGEGEEQDSQEMFGWVVTFIKEFKRAYTDLRPPQR